MLDAVIHIPEWFEIAAALSGGISGAMYAVRARYDLFGTICIALAAGLSGGIIRDVLLQDYGIYSFQHPSLLIGCICTGVVVFFLGKLMSYLDPVVNLLDNVSLSLWAIISAGKGLSAGFDVIPSICVGVIAAIGGGVVRDTLMSRQPEAFMTGTLYGSASVAGIVVFVIMKYYGFYEIWAPYIGAGIILAVRYISLAFGLKTQPPQDLSDKVTKVVAKPAKAIAKNVKKPAKALSGKVKTSNKIPGRKNKKNK